MKIKVLDCTLRDGGYYNDWDFDPVLVVDYLVAVAKAEVGYVELGLRQFEGDRFLGAHAYTTHQYLNRLELPEGPVYGVMIDAKTILSCKETPEKSVNRLFKDCANEKIDLVRIAAHFHEVPDCLPIITILKQKGYLVGLNVMQASLQKSDHLTDVAKLVDGWGIVDVLYFADSLGSMREIDVERIYDAIKNGWSGDIGFHAHNNMGQGVENVNFAIDLGCNWVDGTVTGMGRGAGNAELERLFELPSLEGSAGELDMLDSLVISHFEPLKSQYGWGSSRAYFRAAQKGIHPTYIQELYADNHIDKSQLPKIINDLGGMESPHVFSRSKLSNVISKTSNNNIVIGANVTPFLAGREVVLVAQTDIASNYRDAIKDYVKAKNAIVMAINIPADNGIQYDYCVASHNEKYRDDQNRYSSKKYEFIAPSKLFIGDEVNIAHDYGLWLCEGAFELYGTYAAIPSKLTLAYAIAFCLEAKAEMISIAGLSGYSSGSPKQKEMHSLFALLMTKNINIKCITPTPYVLPQGSIYCV